MKNNTITNSNTINETNVLPDRDVQACGMALNTAAAAGGIRSADTQRRSGVLPHDHGTRTFEIFEGTFSETSFEDVADMFSVIADSTRLKVFTLLCHTEDCVINIAATVGMSSPAVSHHLKVLKTYKLISSRKVGKEVYYTVADTNEAKLLHKAVDDMMQIRCTALQR